MVGQGLQSELDAPHERFLAAQRAPAGGLRGRAEGCGRSEWSPRAPMLALARSMPDKPASARLRGFALGLDPLGASDRSAALRGLLDSLFGSKGFGCPGPTSVPPIDRC